jgi:hypothetical protein
MRFTPDSRLIDHMVGQLFYQSPDVAMRELLQNAEDACSLQLLNDGAFVPEITVRYSQAGNWVEVIDNGLGMNQETLDKSFTAIGASKDGVAHIRDLLAKSADSRQIAFFGVGILSCFGVAENVVVRTKMDGSEGIAFRIPNHHSDFEPLTDAPAVRGTNIRLALKPSGPMNAGHVPDAVKRYARHASHLIVEDADTGVRGTLPEHWHGSDLAGVIEIPDPEIRKGFLALHSSWDQSPGSIPAPELVICNSGFLAKDRETELLPPDAIGYVGEIDIKPKGLTIQLNREGFVQDDKWQQMRTRLLGVYRNLMRAKIGEWERIVASEPERATTQGIDNAVLLLTRGPTRGVLDEEMNQRLDRLLPAVVRLTVRGKTRPIALSGLIEEGRRNGVVYFIREGEAPRQFQQSVQHGTGTVQVTEVAQTEQLRVSHLQAKGAIVVACRQRACSFVAGTTSRTVSWHEADLMSEQCGREGIRFANVNDATAEEVELTSEPQSALLSDLLGLGEPLKLIAIHGLEDRVLRDFTGRLLNCCNEEVREILRILPDAVGNPVRRLLLQIYMDLQSYRLDDARQRAKQLLTMPDLAEQAQLTTGRLLKEFLDEALRPLIESTDGSHE